MHLVHFSEDEMFEDAEHCSRFSDDSGKKND